MYSKYVKLRQRRAGRRYEYYIAWLLRKDGWTVIETGTLGVHDHGIDLVATKEGKKRFVQCKGWKRDKLLHNDVVSQLYGSVAAQVGVDKIRDAEIYIYSPAKLDDYAQQEANNLNIRFERVFFPRWHRKHRYKKR